MSILEPKGKGKADEHDKRVGEMLRERRIDLGLSQQKLAEKIGVTFQQVQKYERGVNRVSASRLQQLSSALQVSVSYFFGNDNGAGITIGFGEDEQQSFAPRNCNAKEVKELISIFDTIKDERIRRQIIEMAKSLAGK